MEKIWYQKSPRTGLRENLVSKKSWNWSRHIFGSRHTLPSPYPTPQVAACPHFANSSKMFSSKHSVGPLCVCMRAGCATLASIFIHTIKYTSLIILNLIICVNTFPESLTERKDNCPNVPSKAKACAYQRGSSRRKRRGWKAWMESQ